MPKLLLDFLIGRAAPEGYAAAFIVLILVCIWLVRSHPPFFAGAVRVLTLLIAAPIRYWGTLVAEVAQESPGSHAREVVRGLPMLRALQSVGKLIVILAGIGALLGGVRAVVSALLPPSEVRALYREAKKDLAETKLALASSEKALSDFDLNQEARARAAEQRHLADAQARVSEAKARMEVLRVEILSNPEARDLFSYLEEQTAAVAERSPAAIASSHRQLRRRMEGASWAGGGDGPLPKWLDAWKDERSATAESAGVAVLVAQEQTAERVELERGRSQQTERLANLEQRVAALAGETSLRWGRCFFVLATSVISLILLIWVLGLALDGFSLWISMAGDLRELRVRSAGTSVDDGTGGSA